MPQDKLLHLTIAALLSVELNRVIDTLFTVIILMALIIGKEQYDKYVKRTMIDGCDIVAGVVGLAIGMI